MNEKRNKSISLDKMQLMNNDIFVEVPFYGIDENMDIVVDKEHIALITKNHRFTGPLSEGTYSFYFDDNVNGKVIYISRTAKLSMPWGTKNRLKINDPNAGIKIEVGAKGEIEVQIEDSTKFYRELVLNEQTISVEHLKEFLSSHIPSEFMRMLLAYMSEKKVFCDELYGRQAELTKFIKNSLTKAFLLKYGLRIVAFTISELYVPREYMVVSNASKYEIKHPTGYCPGCGTEYFNNEHYCPKCGLFLVSKEYACSKCGKLNILGAKFCSRCGNPLNVK